MSNNVDIQKCKTTKKYIDKDYNLKKFNKKQKCGDIGTKCIETDLFDQDDDKDNICIKDDFEFDQESLAQKIKEKMINCDKFLHNDITTGLMLANKKTRRGKKFTKYKGYKLETKLDRKKTKLRHKLSRFDKNGKKISYDNYDQFPCLDYANVLKRKCKNNCQEGPNFECNRYKKDKKEDIYDYGDIDLLDSYSNPQLYYQKNPYKAYWKINPDVDKNNVYQCRKSKKALKNECEQTCPNKKKNICSRLKNNDSYEEKRTYPEDNPLYKCILSKKTLKENCKKQCSKKKVCTRFYKNNVGFILKRPHREDSGDYFENNPYKCISNEHYEKLKELNQQNEGATVGQIEFSKQFRKLYTQGRGTEENQ